MAKKRRAHRKTISKATAAGTVQAMVEANAHPDILVPFGNSGLKRNAGLINEEWQNDLKGKKAAKVYQEMMDNDTIIAAALHIFDLLLRQTPIRVEPADDSNMAQMVADHVESCLHDMDGGWTHVLSEALSMNAFGWCAQEKVYKLRRGRNQPPEYQSKHNDGRFGWREFRRVAQNTLEKWYYDTDRMVGLQQRVMATDGGTFSLPRAKFLHHRLKAPKNNPEGRALLRPCYLSYYYKKNHMFVEAVGIERYLAGMPVMQVPLNIMHSNPSTQAATLRSMYEQLVREVRVDDQGGIVIPAETDANGQPTGYKFSLMSGGGNRPADTDPILRRYDSRIAMALMMEVILLGDNGVGSYAQTKEKNDLVAIGLAAMLEAILQQFNDDAVPELVALNGWPDDLIPTLSHGHIKAPNLAELGSFIGAVSGAGLLTPDAQIERAIRDLAELPEMDDAVAEGRIPPGMVPPGMADGPAPADVLPEGIEPEPVPDDIKPPEQVADTALNSAQVASLINIVQEVAAGNIPRESGVQMISAAFQMTTGKADAILGPAGRGFRPATGGNNAGP